jgi:LPS-assembly protein
MPMRASRRALSAIVAILAALAAAAVPAQPAANDALPVPALRSADRLAPPSPSARAGLLPGVDASRGAKKAPAAEPDDSPVFVRADRLEGVSEQYFEAEGGVELRTRTQTIRADWLRYDVLSDEIWGKGSVVLRQGIDWVTGPEFRFKRDTEIGFFRDAQFYFGQNGARGSAADLQFAGPDRYEVTDARYTTCAASREDWFIALEQMDLDQTRKVGTGRNATLHFLGMPIGYTPWIEFPLSGERKSGFLTPILGSSVSRGFELATPYYLNLAPDYDATLVPRFMSKRGLQLGGQFRYLDPQWSGELNGAYLYDDKQTGTDRYLISWKHNQAFPQLPGLSGYLNLNAVSDSTYFSDLSASVALTSQTALPREGGLAWSRGPYSLLARAQTYQSLVPGAPPEAQPYNRVPQLLLNVNDLEWGGFDFGLTTEYASFRQPKRVEGDRVYAYPTIAWSRSGPWWFFKAKGGVNARYYSLAQAREGTTTPTVTLPIASLDAGIYFERQDSFFGREIVQTLEPRAYYAYIPYKDQRTLPNFDSALDDFNFPQLFTENRYLGYDRIGDANQLTLAASSRFLSAATSEEHLRVAIGQRFYFSDQRLTLGNEAPRSSSSSDLLLGAEGRLSSTWSIAGLWQVNLDSSQTERLNFGARYTPSPGRALNATYTYTRNAVDPAGGATFLKQFDVSTQWPVGGNWSVVARWNYSMADSKTLEAVGGVEYNGDCWALRIVGQRLTTTLDTTSTSIYAQLELSGFARIGTNPLDLLRRTVPGYQKLNESAGSLLERGADFNDF